MLRVDAVRRNLLLQVFGLSSSRGDPAIERTELTVGNIFSGIVSTSVSRVMLESLLLLYFNSFRV